MPRLSGTIVGNILFVSALTLTSVTAHAGGGGYYASVFVGASIPSDANFDGIIGGNPQTVGVESDTGYVVGGTLGRSWDFGTFRSRGEIEVSYRESDVDEVFFSGNGPAAEVNVNGDTTSTTVFANALLDFPISDTPLTAYTGLGVGISFVDQEFVYGPGVRVDASDEVFAAQLIAGISYDVTDRIALTLDGRYQWAFGVEGDRLAPTGALTGTIEDDLNNFDATIGMRYSF